MEQINLLPCNVKHKKWGLGTIVDQTENNIWVEFSVGQKQFKFPSAFEVFLDVEDENQREILDVLIQEEKNKAEQKKRERLSELEKNIVKADPVSSGNAVIKKKAYPKENIAFKCNYCDGGKDATCIGYKCACSEEMIDYNIEVAKHNWCRNTESPCSQYYDGLINREELDQWVLDGGFVCYESQMLRNWKAFAGNTLTGENKDKPMKLNKVQVNSLAILTTREPYAKESERFVFAVFLVDEAYEGDNKEEGFVTTNSKYRISLSEKEAKKILYWNYYRNENASEKIAWGQGLHRYLSDVQAASILKDIVEVKRGKKEEELALEFLNHFCKINKIDEKDLPVYEGPLKKK